MRIVAAGRILAATLALGGMCLAEMALAAAPTGRCAAQATGRWKVLDFEFGDVAAMSDKEARRYVGQIYSISAKTVTIGGVSCVIESVDRYQPTAKPGYVNGFDFGCHGEPIVPGIVFDRGCSHAVLDLDGVTFRLKKLS